MLLLLLLQSRFQDSMLGRVQIPVADVARNGCLKDTWALLVSVIVSQGVGAERRARVSFEGSLRGGP